MSYSYSEYEPRQPMAASNNPFEEPERKPTENEIIVSKILDVQQESRSSTQRSLALLHQSEEVGAATSTQLVEQGERLGKIDNRISTIDQNLKQSQKHINGLKSVFGGISNWWQSRKEKKETKEEPSGMPSSSNSDFRGGGMMKKSQSEHSTLSSRTYGGSSRLGSRPVGAGTTVQTVIEQNEQDIEEDLDQMSVLTQRLKEMAQEMGSEIDKQNVVIDHITTRVEHTQSTVGGQNKQMNKILKK